MNFYLENSREVFKNVGMAALFEKKVILYSFPQLVCFFKILKFLHYFWEGTTS
jgi:hypothetical protein